MIDSFLSGGPLMWPMLLVAAGIIVVAVRAAAGSVDSPGEESLRRPMSTILFWGIVAFLLGLLGTLVGLVQMAGSIQRAGGASETLVWGGVALSLVSVVFGIVVLLIAGLAWFGLHLWSARAHPGAA